MKEPDLRGKTALVTGASRGIGKATAEALVRCGARVVVTSRSRDEIEAVAREFRAAGGEALAVCADVSRIDDVRHLLERAGEVDILVNNAGVIEPIGPVAAVPPDAWLYNIAVNLDGVFLPCHFALPGMLTRGWGRIINVSSGSARGTVAGWSAYSAAKAGLEALTSVLSREVVDRGVYVNAVRPGIVDTEMQETVRGSSEEAFGRENLARYRRYKEEGYLRDPADPARLILWLLTEEAGDLTGEVLAIDDPEVAARIGLVPVGR